MPSQPPNYFRYFSLHGDSVAWGLSLTAAGWSQIPAGTAYPPPRHPADHHFTWERGRVLETLQIVLITTGRGEWQAERGEPTAIEAGMAFAVLPRVWHRYRPDPRTGWTESWIEVQGPIVDRLIEREVFNASTALRPGASAAGLEGALEAVHARARNAAPSFDPEFSARAFGVLAAWTRMGSDNVRSTAMGRAVLAAEQYLAEHCTEAVSVELLARRLGVAYSHFRRAFREQTGFAPWKYVLQLRLTRARRLLASTDATLDEVAVALGFSSGFHFSAAFKKAYGLSPTAWRKRLQIGEGAWNAGRDRRAGA